MKEEASVHVFFFFDNKAPPHLAVSPDITCPTFTKALLGCHRDWGACTKEADWNGSVGLGAGNKKRGREEEARDSFDSCAGLDGQTRQLVRNEDEFQVRTQVNQAKEKSKG